MQSTFTSPRIGSRKPDLKPHLLRKPRLSWKPRFSWKSCKSLQSKGKLYFEWRSYKLQPQCKINSRKNQFLNKIYFSGQIKRRLDASIQIGALPGWLASISMRSGFSVRNAGRTSGKRSGG